MDAQAGLRLYCSKTSEDRISRDVAHLGSLNASLTIFAGFFFSTRESKAKIWQQ